VLQIIHSTGEFVRNIGRIIQACMSPAKPEAQLAPFIEQVPASIAIFDAEMRYLAVSRRYLSDAAFLFPTRVFSPAQVVGCSHYELFPDMPLRWHKIHARVLAGEELAEGEDVVPHQDGNTECVRWSMKPWRTADGRIGGALLFSELITEQIAAKRALAESEVRFRATFENAPVGIAHLSPELRWLRANGTFCRIIGWPIDELVDKSLREISHPDDFAHQLAHIEQIRQGKIDSYKLDKRFIRRDGAIAWGRLTVSSVRKGDGSADYFVHVLEDISAQKRAEELLRRQAEVLDQSHDAIFTFKIGDGISFWNRGAEALYGYTCEQAIGRIPHELLQTRSDVSNQEIETQTAQTGSWYGELTHTTREGREIVVESRHVRVSYDGDLYALETNRDITARKRAEDELRESEERFRSSILHSPVPTILFDDQEQIFAVSRTWLKAAGGVSAAELHRIEDWTIRAYGERSGEVLELIRGIIATEPEARTDELMILTRDGDKRLWNFVTSGLGTKSDGRRLFVSVAQDVTDRRAYEERIHLLMREARHRTKNILGLVQAIARQIATGDAPDFIARFTERIGALAANQDLLVRHEWQRIDVRDLAQAQLGHFADLIGRRINLDGPKLLLNAAAAQAIGLALHELATNAGKYGALSTDAGRVDVSWQLDDDTFVISWIERNGPPVRPPERKGFGSTVTASMVKQTLGGEVKLDYPPSGLEWRMTCHAADALQGRG
jgi:PAS domain S-box-containing protein